MNVIESTSAYEKWLARSIRLVPADLRAKHQFMADDVFAFFRATFYRWMQLWPEQCSDLASAPEVLACGDLHIENFGTWRDAEGRLVWGINDFDEAFPLPYTLDLVRLAASSHLANLTLAHGDACQAILTGYENGIKSGGRPFLLAERHVWLREAAWNELRDPVRFWERLTGLPKWRGKVPGKANSGLLKCLPKGAAEPQFLQRRSGLGSLGRQRIVALTEYSGGLLAREAKALAPSACLFASGRETGRILYEQVLRRAVRDADPFLRVGKSWVFRRLSPDCCRVELSSLKRVREQTRLLEAMGFEVANLHLGTAKAIPAIRKDLASRPAGWLHDHSAAMVQQTLKDWKIWRKKAKQ